MLNCFPKFGFKSVLSRCFLNSIECAALFRKTFQTKKSIEFPNLIEMMIRFHPYLSQVVLLFVYYLSEILFRC